MALTKIGVLFYGKNPNGKAPLSRFMTDELKNLLIDVGEGGLAMDANHKNCGRPVIFKNQSKNNGKIWFDVCLQTGAGEDGDHENPSPSEEPKEELPF